VIATPSTPTCVSLIVWGGLRPDEAAGTGHSGEKMRLPALGAVGQDEAGWAVGQVAAQRKA